MQTAAADLWHAPACAHPWLSIPPTPLMLVALPCAAGRLTSWSTSTLSRCASACTASLTDQLPHEPPHELAASQPILWQPLMWQPPPTGSCTCAVHQAAQPQQLSSGPVPKRQRDGRHGYRSSISSRMSRMGLCDSDGGGAASQDLIEAAARDKHQRQHQQHHYQPLHLCLVSAGDAWHHPLRRRRQRHR